MTPNPYNWQVHKPRVTIPRPDVDLVTRKLLTNGSAVVLGGRGMGKSVFLHQVKSAVERSPAARVLVVDAPPPALTIEACLGELADLLATPGGAMTCPKRQPSPAGLPNSSGGSISTSGIGSD